MVERLIPVGAAVETGMAEDPQRLRGLGVKVSSFILSGPMTRAP